MKIIKQSHEILNCSIATLQMIERAGRTCYKSGDKITKFSAESFVKNIIKRGHDAMLEFGDITVRFITNRGVSHEMVRHRLCSFAQESTRYVKYGDGMEFIEPVWWGDSNQICKSIWLESAQVSMENYVSLLNNGWKAQQARDVLPNCLKTEIVVKGNTREWRHMFKQRCAKTAHPQMYELMRPLLTEVKERIPVLYDDLTF